VAVVPELVPASTKVSDVVTEDLAREDLVDVTAHVAVAEVVPVMDLMVDASPVMNAMTLVESHHHAAALNLLDAPHHSSSALKQDAAAAVAEKETQRENEKSLKLLCILISINKLL
jgi:hypothetical protein